MQQRTIKRPIEFTGITLHGGLKSTVKIFPACVNSGISFRRNGVLIPALADYVTSTILATTLENHNQKIQTVEHILAACASLLLDNLIIECSTEEIPIMDGSANPFVMLLLEAGIKTQFANKQFLRITRKVRVEDGDKYAEFSPCDDISYSLQTKFDHPLIDRHTAIQFSLRDNFIHDVSRARTFGFITDIEYLRSKNLALGGSMDNAIVLDNYKMLNDDPLRYEDEFIRHKLIDAIGDLHLLGYNFIGAFDSYKTGHGLNNKLARKVLKENAYEIVDHKKHEIINNSIQSQTLAEVL